MQVTCFHELLQLIVQKVYQAKVKATQQENGPHLSTHPVVTCRLWCLGLDDFQVIKQADLNIVMDLLRFESVAFRHVSSVTEKHG